MDLQMRNLIKVVITKAKWLNFNDGEKLEYCKSRVKLSWGNFNPLNSHLLFSSVYELTSFEIG